MSWLRCRDGGPQVVTSSEIAVNLHRLDDGVAVHLVNYGYDDEGDAVAVTDDFELTVRPPEDLPTATAVRPGRSPEPLDLTRDGDRCRVRLTDVGLYTVVGFR